jgi:hypothetical protein
MLALRTLLLMALATPLAAQVTFQRHHDHPTREFSPRDQVQTADGGFVVAGDAYLTGTQQSRPYLMALDASGDVGWCREYRLLDGFHKSEALLLFGPDLFVVLVDIQQIQKPALMVIDGDGDFLVAIGYALGPGELTIDDVIATRDGGVLMVGRSFHPGSGQDVAVIKIGPSGAPQWAREWSGPVPYPQFGANDFAVDAVELPDGSGYVVLGRYASDAMMTLLDPAGDPLLHRTYAIDGASLFETALTYLPREGSPDLLLANADLANDRFPLVLELDAAGAPLSPVAPSLPLSVTKAAGTSDGGFVLAGLSLITPGSTGLRLARYDAGATLQWARQFDVQPTFATVNPPANVIETDDGGFLLSLAAVVGLDPVQHMVRVGAAGQLGCGAGGVPPPTSFVVTSSVVTPVVSSPSVAFALLPFSETALAAVASPDCP